MKSGIGMFQILTMMAGLIYTSVTILTKRIIVLLIKKTGRLKRGAVTCFHIPVCSVWGMDLSGGSGRPGGIAVDSAAGVGGDRAVVDGLFC